MKYNKIITTGLVGLALVGVLSSCEKDEVKLVAQPKMESNITGTLADVVINPSKLDEVALSFVRTDAEFTSGQIAIDYKLVIKRPEAKEGEVAMTAVQLDPKGKEVKFTHRELNDILINKLKMKTGVAETIDLAILAQPYTAASTTVPQSAQILGKVTKLVVTPAEIRTKSLDYFFVGNMFGVQEWKKDYDGFPFFLDAPDGKIYTYTGLFVKGAEFKIDHEERLGDWSKVLGTTAKGQPTLGGGENIKDASAGGYFTVTFDPEKLTYSVEPFDASSSTVYDAIGLIGTASGGWDRDVLLTKSTYDPHIWRGEGIKIGAGELKIRANKDWAKNWGGKGFPVAVSDTGDNIKVSVEQAGTYNVMFNDLTGHYHLRKTAN